MLLKKKNSTRIQPGESDSKLPVIYVGIVGIVINNEWMNKGCAVVEQWYCFRLALQTGPFAKHRHSSTKAQPKQDPFFAQFLLTIATILTIPTIPTQNFFSGLSHIMFVMQGGK